MTKVADAIDLLLCAEVNCENGKSGQKLGVAGFDQAISVAMFGVVKMQIQGAVALLICEEEKHGT